MISTTSVHQGFPFNDVWKMSSALNFAIYKHNIHMCIS